MGNGTRIRELKRKLLHEKNKVVRDIYIEHIKYLQEQK